MQTNKCHPGQKDTYIQMDTRGCTNTIKNVHKQNNPDSTSSIRTVLTESCLNPSAQHFLLASTSQSLELIKKCCCA